MKKIINGKKYDTETATKIGEYSNGYSTSDFHYIDETLYRKKTGEFFLYGEGGPMTRYSHACGDLRGYGDAFIPMSDEETRKWAEEHLDVDYFEEIFGVVEE